MLIPDFVKIGLPCIGMFLAAVIFLYRGSIFSSKLNSELFTVFAFLCYGLIVFLTRSEYLFIFLSVVFSAAIIASKGTFYEDKRQSELFFSATLSLISIMSFIYGLGIPYPY